MNIRCRKVLRSVYNCHFHSRPEWLLGNGVVSGAERRYRAFVFPVPCLSCWAGDLGFWMSDERKRHFNFMNDKLFNYEWMVDWSLVHDFLNFIRDELCSNRHSVKLKYLLNLGRRDGIFQSWAKWSHLYVAVLFYQIDRIIMDGFGWSLP